MGLVVFLTLIFSLNAEAKSCRLPDKPVQDQDGLGSCYANTASLMMEHNLKLPSTPSYFQLSMNASAHRGTFMYTDKEGVSDLFNRGGWVCETFDSAKKEGYCDSGTFEWDAVGTTDPQLGQETFLNSLGALIENHRAELSRLSNTKMFSEERQKLERQLAGVFQNRAQLCQTKQEDFLADRFFDRLKRKWSDRLKRMKPGADRTALSKMYDKTFTAGLATPEARAYLTNDFLPRSFDDAFLATNPSVDALKRRNMLPEKMFEIWWWNKLKLPGKFSPFEYEGYEYVKDYKSRSACREDETIVAVKSLVFGCGQVPAIIEPRHEETARDVLKAIQLATRSGEAGLKGLVNLISPMCGAEMQARKGKIKAGCNNKSISDELGAVAAAAEMEDEICQGRAVGIAFCTGFLKSSTPINSQFCTQDVPGIEKHGRHAVALVGVKNNLVGERVFLMQNSWGRSCPFLQHSGGKIPDALKGLVECEMSNGSPTGRFWVNEKLMMNNTYAYQIIK
ncbi:MAG: hypothetical protein ACLGG0_09350 [Bacteriovoracia bacterium]